MNDTNHNHHLPFRLVTVDEGVPTEVAVSKTNFISCVIIIDQ